MAFHSRIESVVITDLADGDVELLDRQPQEADGGWDSMRDRYLIRDDAAGIDPQAAVAARLLRGTQLDGLNMWIVSRSPKCKARGIFEVEVTSMGLLSDRGYKVKYSAAASSSTGQNIMVGIAGPYANVEALDAGVTADLQYVVIGSVVPSDEDFPTSKVGRQVDPPDPWKAFVPETTWSGLTTYTKHVPDGWAFMSADMENLPGLSTVWLQTDRYQYRYEKTPG